MAADADSGSLGSRFKGLLNGNVLSNSGKKISGKGISCGGGVHSLDLAGGLLHPAAGVLIDAPFGAQRQNNPTVGEPLQEQLGIFFYSAVFSTQLAGFYLVEEELTDMLQR